MRVYSAEPTGFTKKAKIWIKKRGGVLVNFFELCTQKHTALMLLFSHFYRKKNHESSVFLYQNLSVFFLHPPIGVKNEKIKSDKSYRKTRGGGFLVHLGGGGFLVYDPFLNGP